MAENAPVVLDTETNADPFRTDDDLFAPLDTRTTPEENRDARLQALVDIANENPEFAPPPEVDEEPLDPRVTRPEDVQPVVVAQPTPEVTTFGDGSSVTVEHTKQRGWKATLSTGIQGTQPEVFYGKTKEEMWSNVAAGKLHATRKIRELNRKVKLQVNEPVQPRVQVQETPITQPKLLTADEKFEIKNKLESDPEAAFDLYFQKKFGLNAEQLQRIARISQIEQKADAGSRASQELEMESVAKAFVSAHPEYYSDDENYTSIVSFLAKEHLGKRLTNKNQDEIMGLLVGNGHWTVDNLEEAFEELSEAGLLNLAPEEELEEETPIVTAPVVTQPVVSSERIASQRVRPRAGQGLRQTQTTTVPTVERRPPSVEELDNLSDEAISELVNGVRRTRMQSARR